MATQKTRETLRFRYGRCLNDECENCKAKKIIEVPARKDFVCPDCGKELHECPPPKKKSSGGLIGGIAAVAVVAILAGCYFLFSGNDEEYIDDELSAIENVQTEENNVVLEDPAPVATEEAPAKVEETPVVEETKPEVAKTPVTTQSASRSKDLGYATWKGALKNGQPNDENGTMTYKESHRIDSRDPQARVAEPGDYIIGEYVEGKLVQGIWYDKNNTVKGSIIIGR